MHVECGSMLFYVVPQETVHSRTILIGHGSCMLSGKAADVVESLSSIFNPIQQHQPQASILRDWGSRSPIFFGWGS